MIHVPPGKSNELQVRVWIENVLARVSFKEEGIMPDSDGSKVIFREVGSP